MKNLLFLLILIVQGNLNATKADWRTISFGVVCLSSGTIGAIYTIKWFYDYIKCKNLEKKIKVTGAEIVDNVWNYPKADNTITHYIRVTIPENCSPEIRKYLEHSENELVALYNKTKGDDLLALIYLSVLLYPGIGILKDELYKYQINA